MPYFIQRPAIKIALLNERQRQKSGLVTAVTMPVANNSQIDQYLQHYFESTREKTNVYVDMALMPKICFYSGMPLIVVDLMIYLCGGYAKNGAPLED